MAPAKPWLVLSGSFQWYVYFPLSVHPITVIPGTQGGEGAQEQPAQVEEAGLPDLIAFSGEPTAFVGG